MSVILFLCAVSILLWAGSPSPRWKGEGQGYRPRPVMSFAELFARLVGYAFGFTVLVCVGLIWLWSFLGAIHL